LLAHRGGHIEQGSISAMGGASIVFRHAHQTSTTRTVLPYRDHLTQSAVWKATLGQFVVILCAALVAKPPGTVPECGQPSRGVRKALKLCAARALKSHRLRGLFRYFGLATRVPFPRGLPFTLGEKTCGTRFEHR
jgi:hypothetical protein